MRADGFAQGLGAVVFGDVGEPPDPSVRPLDQHFAREGGQHHALGVHVQRDHKHAVGIAQVAGAALPAEKYGKISIRNDIVKSEFIKEDMDETVFMFALFKCRKFDKRRN